MTDRRQFVTIEQLVDGLAGNIEGVIDAIGLRGERQGHEFVAFNPLRADNNLGSFRIELTGAKAGVWADFALNDKAAKGDALNLVAYILFAGNVAEACKWARVYLGIDDGDLSKVKTRRGAAGKKKARQLESNKSRTAFNLWLDGQASLRDTPAAAYLRGRGIDLARLGRQPGALRYHPKLKCVEDGNVYPAMLAAITGASGKIVAVHRTWLQVGTDAAGRLVADKAPLQSPRKVLGRYKGGAIYVARGAVIDAETGEVKPGVPIAKAPPNSTLAITEGIEDALTFALAQPSIRVWAAVSVANMASLALPDAIGTVILCLDNDGDNEQAAAQQDRAIAHYLDMGKDVKIVRASVGKDLNDRLRAG